MEHLFAKIENMRSKLSKGQKRIAQYIEEHYDKAAFMTASRLGETVGVSESTVVRFAVEIGYDGYPKLQKAMQELIKDKLTSVQRIEVTSTRFGEDNILESVLNQDIEKIKRTIEEVSHDDFEAAVKAIVEAENIYIFAVRSSSALANFLGYYFDLIFGNVRVVSTTSKIEIYEKLLHINENDAIIGISFPRYSKTAVEGMKFASDRNASVIAITDSMISPLVAPADYVLLASSDMASIVDSLVAPLSLINALIVATVLAKKASVESTFQRLETYWDKYDVYAKTSEIAKYADENEEKNE
ncbi:MULTISPECIES: MurR/RpiR family transcriptional regulator [unclassified Ruminococcus]|uniref:MurR/RpiR family transcriptional regulator n=1 Tax=unclassified Ruminococcus TaxID=2608920 RepID=UPI00210D03C0|nr:MULTISPECIES: MurR/RpiR family transcriptional regulator [unclassified Ruminococcus]MCQ4021849.1 SIS domain-containing protein [Ruminococcus sp. zg-924]MCQ4114294.1 SIS domain-containing protein [Ruminococcus sp. zg-921]